MPNNEKIRYSAIAAMGLDGIVDVHITSGSVNDDRCNEFIAVAAIYSVVSMKGV